MNIVSNNCLGGYIYQNLLHEEYKNPFIWTLFENPDDYIEIIRNWNNVNFDNFEITKKGKEFKNNFQIIIDEKYPLSFIHIFFDAQRNTIEKFEHTPRIVGENILTPKPWEYIVEKYTQRLARMKNENDTIFLYFEPNLKCSKLEELPIIFQHNKFRGIIFTDNATIKENEYTKVFPALGLDLPSKICNHYKKELLELCKPL